MPSDKVLKALTSNDPRSVVDALAKEHMGRIHERCRRWLRDPVTAEDIMQEAFIQIGRSLENLDDPLYVVDFLDGIARNLCRNQNKKWMIEQRRREDDEVPELPVDAMSLDDALDLLMNIRLLVECLDDLPPSQAEAIKRHYCEGVLQVELAEERGVVKTAISNMFRRLRMWLVECVQTKGGGP